MTAAIPARSEVVKLEPDDRADRDAERAALVAEIEAQLPDAIASPAEYAAIADLEKRCDRFIANHEPAFDDHCATARKVWLQACEIRSVFLDAPKQLKARCRALLGAYKELQDRIRRDEERRIADAQRLEEVARRKAEARALEQAGQKELAAVVRAAPVETAPVVLPSVVPDVAGLSYREVWTWEPVGGDTPTNRTRALSVMVRPDVLPFVSLNDGGLTAFATRTKGTIKVPGIRFFSKQVPVRR